MGNRDTISKPSDLDIPSRMKEVLDGLTDDGRRLFAEEFVAALAESQESNDLSPMQYVVNAWWVSSLFLGLDGIDRAFEAAEADDSEPMTAEQVGVLLGVA